MSTEVLGASFFVAEMEDRVTKMKVNLTVNVNIN